MVMILVTPLSAITDAVARYQPSHMVTLMSDRIAVETPAEIAPENHLRLTFSDITVPVDHQTAPTEEHVRRLIAFGRNWNGSAPILVHCWAGISRSMAAAYILLCDKAGSGAEYAIARNLRSRAAHANPNRRIIRLADVALQREGRMIDAVDAMGRAKFVEHGVPVELPLEAMVQ